MGVKFPHFNGVNGVTGEYLLEPQAPDVISKIAQGETWIKPRSRS